MANYYEYSVADVTSPDMVGVGSGDAPDGSLRICVALDGEPINPGLREEPAALRLGAPLPGQDEELSPEHYRTWGARWPSEPATPQDRHRQGLPCEFCDGRVADVEHQTTKTMEAASKADSQ